MRKKDQKSKKTTMLFSKGVLLVFVLAFLFVSCGSGGSDGTSGANSGLPKTVVINGEVSADYPNEIKEDKDGKLIFENEGEVISDENSVLKVGLISSSPFKGLFSALHYTDAIDGRVMGYTASGTLIDSQYKLKKGGAVYLEFDKENKKMIYHIDPRVKWYDGTPVTSRDIQYAYEIVGHGQYTGPRYDRGYKNIVGMEEYHYGTLNEKDKADFEKENPTANLKGATDISGLKIVDDHTLEVSLKEFGVSILWGVGEGVISPEPYEYLKDIPIADLETSDKIRNKPLSYGPWYIDKVVDGQSVEYKANPYFWLGEPKIKKIELKIVNPDIVTASMQNGEYDIYLGDVNADYSQVKTLDNYVFAKVPTYSYIFIGFKLGKQIPGREDYVLNPDAKMGNVNLRKAMDLAVNPDLISKEYFDGLRTRGTTFLPSKFNSLKDPNIKPVEYNPEEAKKLLDEAGYKDIDGDGYREDPKGNKLEIIFAAPKKDQKGDNFVDYLINEWKEVGLNVKLKEGKTIEFNRFLEITNQDEGIDIYLVGMNSGSNPNPRNVWGPSSYFNKVRWVNEEFSKELKRLDSEEGFDDSKRKEILNRLQEIFFDQRPALVLFNTYDIKPINKRIKHYELSSPDDKEELSWGEHEIEFIAPEPIKSTTLPN